MKNFVIKGLIFILIFFLLDALLGQFFSILFSKTDFIYNKVLKNKYEILLFGDSKCRHGVIPRIINQHAGMSSYNIARYGSGMMYSVGIASLVLQKYSPKVMAIEVMSLDDDREAIHSLAPYFREQVVKNFLGYYPYDIQFKYTLCKTLPYNNSVITAIYRLFFTNYDPDDGYVPLFGVASVDRTSLNKNGMPTPENKELKNIQVDLLINLIGQAKENNIIVFFFEMPILAGLEDYPTFTYKDISRKCGIPYFDFQREDRPPLLDESCFNDATHLNDKGSGIISEKIGKKILQFFR